MLRLVLPMALLLASACGPSLIVMHNPKTGEVAQCEADPWATFRPRAATEACAQAYEKAGWDRM
jgi:hypothetical protein